MLVAAFAAYAFAWMDFPVQERDLRRDRRPAGDPAPVDADPGPEAVRGAHIAGEFLAVWLAHTGYGLPFAIYLLRNYMGGLPREVFESAAIDGASPTTSFFRLALPMSVPVLASLTIFQFLFVWNDLLVSLIYIGPTRPENLPMTVVHRQPRQLARRRDPLPDGGGLPHDGRCRSSCSSALQRYFVRGITGGAVKG